MTTWRSVDGSIPRGMSGGALRRLALVAVAAVGLGVAGLPAVPASAAVAAVPNDPPGNNHSIIAFPVRDFVSGDGYAQGDLVTVEVIRSGQVVGTSSGVVPTDDPATPFFDGAIQVNHPGGSCWQGVTPDLRAGDIVRTTTGSGQVDQSHVADVTVTSPATQVGTDIVETGTAADAAGNPLPIGAIQARIIANKLSFDVNGKRDIRAPGNGIISYDAPGSIHWTATWSGLDAHDLNQALAGESRGLWLGATPGAVNSLGSPVETTIYEFGQVGGPAAPCTAPLATGPNTPDMTAVTDSGSSNTDNVTKNATPTFVGATGTAPAGSVTKLYVDGVLNGTGTVSAARTYTLTPTTVIPDGVHAVTASEVDSGSGIETVSAAALSVTIDTAAPGAPTVTSVFPGPTGSTLTPSVGGTAEPGSTVTLSADAACTTTNGTGSASAFNTTGVTGTVAANSTTTFWASVADAAGNPSPCSSTSVTYTHDSAAPPNPTIDSSPASPSKSSAPTFTFSDTEAGVTFACSMTTGANAFGPCASPKSYTGRADGNYTFAVRASDAAGNTSTATTALTIDTTSPVVTIDTAPSNPTNSNAPAFGFSSQPGSTFQCSMSTGTDSFAPCTSPMSYTAQPDGSYTFKVKATDPAGNAGAATARPLTIDTVAPSAVITGTPPNPSNVNTPSFDFASADTTATFQCSLTLASSTLDNFQPCTSPKAYPARANGNWVFKVKATDPAGNTGAPDTYAFTINTNPATAPAAPTGVSATAGNASAAVSWTAPANGGSPIIDYTVRTVTTGAAVPAVTVTGTSATISGLVNGTTYSFKVTARNAVGNGPASAASNTVVPAVPATVPAAPTGVSATPGNASATVSWTAPANGGSPILSYDVQVRTGTVFIKTVNSGSAATSATITGLTNGTSYSFKVRAVNAVGTGAYSVTSAPITAGAVATVPGKPTIGNATPGVAGGAITATANWPAATNTGGSAITGYKVRALRISSTGTVLSTTTSTLQPASQRSLAMTLPASGNYRFTVQAFNSVGGSAQSARSNQVAGQ